MKHIEFDPAKLTGPHAAWWQKWQARADAATVAAIDAWERGGEVTFNEAIWRDLKVWLLDNVFHGKCAYCETKAVRYPGHAEHFRPKGRVDVDENGKSVPASVEWPNGKVDTHPGYFWLAYHWKNLLPACHECNSGRGKQNQFPLEPPATHTLVPRISAAQAAKVAARARESVTWRQRYYLDPDTLDELERPQILNPYVDEPRKHLRFGQGGVVTAIAGSLKGQSSIRVYQLDEENLRIDRQKAQKKAEMTFKSTLGPLLVLQAPSAAIKAAFDALADYKSGEEPYSTAALDYVELVVEEIKAAFQGGG